MCVYMCVYVCVVVCMCVYVCRYTRVRAVVCVFIVEAQWDDPCAGFTDTDIPVHWQISRAFLSYNHSENAI